MDKHVPQGEVCRSQNNLFRSPLSMFFHTLKKIGGKKIYLVFQGEEVRFSDDKSYNTISVN